MADEPEDAGKLAFTVHGLVAVGVLHGEENLFDFRSLLVGLLVSTLDQAMGDE
jgi:hypothetical protein